MTNLIKAERTVLVVDDVAAIQALVAAILASPATTILQASNGEDGISIAQDQRPDVILLDLAMSGLDGTETLRRLRSMPETQEIPVVIVTSQAHSEMAQQASALGANDLIEKPFRPAELRHVVDKWTVAPPAAPV